MKLRFLSKLAVKTLALLMVSCGLWLSSAAAQQDEGAEQPAPMPSGTAQSGFLVHSMSMEPTDFNFNNTDVLFILKTFALRFNKNIIPSSSVGGKVTLALKQVPFDEAFQILLDKMNLVAIQRSRNIIEVIKKSEMPLLMETFPLKNRFAGDIKVTLEALLSPQEKEKLTIASDDGSNSLIITANTAQLSKIRSLVNQIDVKAPQIRIKTRIIELETGSLSSMGISWGGASMRGKTTGRAANNVATLAPFAVTGISPTTALTGTTFAKGAFFDLSKVMDKSALYAVLNMLSEDSSNKTLSEPSIMTGNNKTAQIHVGKNLPVVTTTQNQTTSVQTITYIKEGIDLEVTPVIAPGSKRVSLKIKINVSELAGYSANNPITSERSAYTEVSMDSEKTVAIGGLVRENTKKTVSGIPVLRSIPILGALFRSKSDESVKTDLLILLTPEIVADQPEAAAVQPEVVAP